MGFLKLIIAASVMLSLLQTEIYPQKHDFDSNMKNETEILNVENFQRVEVNIINGTETVIGNRGRNFIFCNIKNVDLVKAIDQYRVQWCISENCPNRIGRYGENNRAVFTLGCTKHVPFCYLVFNGFHGRTMAGNYTCQLTTNDEIIHTSDIHVLSKYGKRNWNTYLSI